MTPQAYVIPKIIHLRFSIILRFFLLRVLFLWHIFHHLLLCITNLQLLWAVQGKNSRKCLSKSLWESLLEILVNDLHAEDKKLNYHCTSQLFPEAHPPEAQTMNPLPSLHKIASLKICCFVGLVEMKSFWIVFLFRIKLFSQWFSFVPG